MVSDLPRERGDACEELGRSLTASRMVKLLAVFSRAVDYLQNQRKKGRAVVSFSFNFH